MSAVRRSFRGGRPRRVRNIAVVTVLVLVGLMWIGSAQAVHDTGMFELDGNVVHNAQTTPPYDWTSLFGSTGNQLIAPDPVNGPLLASVFVNDTDAVDNTYFAGGTKIDNPIHSMACGGPAANDKTSIDYTYAAMVHIPAGAPDNAGDNVLYLGLEKQAAGNGGDNAFGFWLFKDKTVGCNPSANNAQFTGAHTDGDLFIDGLFTNGGGSSDIEVFRWNGNDTTGSLGSTAIATGDVCGVLANDQQCAIANNGPITSGPWRSSTTMAADTFVEAGIDLTTLLGAQGGCFSTFMADSQSSQSLNSQPKDFAGGTLNTCVTPPITTTATPGGSNVPLGDTNQQDVANLSAVGGHPSPTGTMTFSLCNPSQVTSAGCPSGAGTQVGNPVPISSGSATSDKASGSLLSTIGKYCWRSDYTPDADGSKFYKAGGHTDNSSECFTVVKNSPSIVTTPNPTSVTLGNSSTTLNDSAVLSGGHSPTGTITFTLVYNGATVDTETVSVSGNNTYTTPKGYTVPTTGTVTGTYQWNATYSGDSTNNSVSENNDPSERVTVSKAGPSLVTTATPHGTVTLDNTGSPKLTDSASLTGGYNPAGSITFTLKYNGVTVDTETATVTGNGTYSTPTGYTLPSSGTVAGSYVWTATYGGDGNNNSASDPGTSSLEQVTVSKAGPSLVTTASPHGSVTLDNTGSPVLKDSASLTGGYNPTGSITFTLKYKGVTVDTETVSVSGNGTYATPTGYTLPSGSTVTRLLRVDGRLRRRRQQQLGLRPGHEPLGAGDGQPGLAGDRDHTSSVVGDGGWVDHDVERLGGPVGWVQPDGHHHVHPRLQRRHGGHGAGDRVR